MRLDFCTGQNIFPPSEQHFPFLPSSTTGQWLLFPIQNNWFSRCFQADLMLGEPNIWYGLRSKLLWSWTKWFFFNPQSIKWEVPWLDHLLIIWHRHHLNKSSSCLHHITLMFRTLGPSHPAERGGDSASNQQWRTNTPLLQQLKTGFKKVDFTNRVSEALKGRKVNRAYRAWMGWMPLALWYGALPFPFISQHVPSLVTHDHYC